MDECGGLPTTPRGHSKVWVFVDKLSKRLVAVPMREGNDAEDLARAFLDRVVQHHGLPRRLVSDRDPRLASVVWQTAMRATVGRSPEHVHGEQSTDGRPVRSSNRIADANATVLRQLQRDGLGSVPPLPGVRLQRQRPPRHRDDTLRARLGQAPCNSSINAGPRPARRNVWGSSPRDRRHVHHPRQFQPTTSSNPTGSRTNAHEAPVGTDSPGLRLRRGNPRPAQLASRR